MFFFFFSQKDDKIKALAKLYVQQNGPQLLEFIKQHRLITQEENTTEEEIQEPEASPWGIQSLLQWVWAKINPSSQQSNTSNDQGLDSETVNYYLDRIIPIALLITVAVTFIRMGSSSSS